MTHLIIKIDMPVFEQTWMELTEDQAKYAAKEAYKAARKSLLQFTEYNEDDFIFKIER